MTTKTSEDWIKDPHYKGLTILDYDGWNRNPKDWEFSWKEELITQQEFERRVCNSTVIWRVRDL